MTFVIRYRLRSLDRSAKGRKIPKLHKIITWSGPEHKSAQPMIYDVNDKTYKRKRQQYLSGVKVSLHKAALLIVEVVVAKSIPLFSNQARV